MGVIIEREGGIEAGHIDCMNVCVWVNAWKCVGGCLLLLLSKRVPKICVVERRRDGVEC